MQIANFDEIKLRAKELLIPERRIIIAIDGRGGAGKSTLARNLSATLFGSIKIEFDWFHLPRALVTDSVRFDIGRFLSEVLIPFQAGKSNLTFAKYNWGYMGGIPDGHKPLTTIENVQNVLIVEGCETFHPHLTDHYDLRIWVNTDLDESLRRGIRRDIDEYGLDPDTVHKAWEEWAVSQERVLKDKIWESRADVVFETTPAV